MQVFMISQDWPFISQLIQEIFISNPRFKNISKMVLKSKFFKVYQNRDNITLFCKFS
jgi:hypothetical protein